MSAAYEMAKRYYPQRWSKERVRSLVDAGKLTEEKYIEIVGLEAGEEQEGDE